ncbi:MAG: hypothetical protein HY683_09630 [Chloroflexi bacterium]|nr:hypothetical protein [Chloroflexota bacterium]
MVVAPLREQPDGLQPGDLVIAVDGRSLESWARAIFALGEPRLQWKAGQTVTYTVVRDGRTVDVRIRLGRYPLSAVLAREWGAVLFAGVFLLVALFVFFRRPAEPAARVLLLGASGIMGATTWSFGLQVSDIVGATGLWLYRATTIVSYLLLWIALVHFWLVFPRPQANLLKWRWLLPSLYTTPYAFVAAYAAVAWAGSAGMLDWLGRTSRTVEPLEVSFATLGLVAAAWQLRGPLDPVSRRRARWVLGAMVMISSVSVTFVFGPQLLLGEPLLSMNGLAVLALLFPISLAFGILRYHLFDIDIIINRALVYATLTAFIVGLYVLIIGSLGTLFQTHGHLGISLLAAGIVAVLFQPIRQRLQHTINRWMYGQRDDPYKVLTRLGHRLEGALPVESILPAVVDTVAQALKIPYVAIALGQGQKQEVVAAHGRPTPDTLRLPLVYQGEELGQMLLAPRSPGEAFNRADWRLLSDLARQTGVVAHTVRLTEDLRRARERLVVSREEERRRLRRDLHDGLGPVLGGITLKLDAARNLLDRDPAAADAVLADVKGQTQRALADIRRLAYALRPPALDQLGLAMALREYAGGLQPATPGGEPSESKGVQVRIDLPVDLPPLPAAVEVGVYRIAVEALTNVERHSRARSCVVQLSLADENILELDVADDGVGLPPGHTTGVGIAAMKERAEELGGSCVVESVPGEGTRVRVCIPVGVHQGLIPHPEQEAARS